MAEVDSVALPSLLQKGLSPVYAILGEEPLQALEAADLIRATAQRAGFHERTVLELTAISDWSEFAQSIGERSLFAERVVLDLRLATGKPGKQGGALLARYLANPSPDLLLLLQLPRPDKDIRRAEWFLALDQHAVVVHARPVPPAQLPRWIRQRLAQQGLQITDDALELLAARVEGNLLAARQEIDKLALLGQERIDRATLDESLVDAARFDLMDLPTAALSGQTARALRMLRGMLSTGSQPELLILWALSRDIRALVQAAQRRAAGEPVDRIVRGFWGTAPEALRKALRRVDPEAAWALLAQAAQVDRVLKGQEPGNPARQLLNLAAALSGRPLPGLEKNTL